MRGALIPALVLCACAAPAAQSRIECRLGPDGAFERVCTLESREREMIVRHPDGGFRRLLDTSAGIEAADGAERPLATRLDDGRLEVEIGGDAYRLPPRVPE